MYKAEGWQQHLPLPGELKLARAIDIDYRTRRVEKMQNEPTGEVPPAEAIATLRIGWNNERIDLLRAERQQHLDAITGIDGQILGIQLDTKKYEA